MAHWDKAALEAEAAKIASAYRAGVQQNGSSINDLAAKFAREQNLTEQQIERLVRATNVAMFDQEYGALKQAGAPDRIVEFETGDPEVVIRELYKQATPVTAKVASSARYPDLTDQLAFYRGRPTLPLQKVASAQENLSAIERILGKEPPVERQLMRLQKVAEELAVKIKHTELLWNTTMQTLGSNQRQLYFNRNAFEKNALALHGEDVLPELNMLRAERKLPALNIPEGKFAELQDRLVGETTPDTNLLKLAAKAREDYQLFLAGREAVQKQIGELRKALPCA